MAVTGGEQAELHAAVDVGEDTAPVLEVEQAGERSGLHHVLEEELGRVVGGDAGGQHASGAAPFVHDVPHRFGEDGVQVDVAPAAQGITAGVAHQMAPTLGFAQVVEEAPVEGEVIRLQRLDHPLARGGGGGVRDLRLALREPFLFLELDLLPRRVAEHAVEAAVLEHFREREIPMEEPIPAGEAFDLPPLRGRQGIGAGVEARADAGVHAGAHRTGYLTCYYAGQTTCS